MSFNAKDSHKKYKKCKTYYFLRFDSLPVGLTNFFKKDFQQKKKRPNLVAFDL